jgi:penicillin-binding protein 1A
MDRPRQIKPNAQGGDLAAPAWTAFMTEVYRRKPAPADWTQPAGVVSVQVIAGTGLLYSPECIGASVATELFVSGLEPTEACDPATYYGPQPVAPGDSLAGDSTGAPFDRPAGELPAGRRATVPAWDSALTPAPPARRRRPAGPARDTLFEQTAPPGLRPSVPPPPGARPSVPPPAR